MTVNEISDGHAFFHAVTLQYGKTVYKLADVIVYCRSAKHPIKLTEVGCAGMERLRKLYFRLLNMKFFPRFFTDDDPVINSLMEILSAMLTYPEMSGEYSLIYTEALFLLDDLLAGGWIE